MSLSLKLVRGVVQLVVLVKLVQLVVELAHLKHLGVQPAIAAWPHIVLVKCLNFTLQAPNSIRGVPVTIPSNLGQGLVGAAQPVDLRCDKYLYF